MSARIALIIALLAGAAAGAAAGALGYSNAMVQIATIATFLILVGSWHWWWLGRRRQG